MPIRLKRTCVITLGSNILSYGSGSHGVYSSPGKPMTPSLTLHLTEVKGGFASSR